MEKQKQPPKTGNTVGKIRTILLMALGMLTLLPEPWHQSWYGSVACAADEVKFEALVDQNKISRDDNLVLQLVVTSSSGTSIGSPQFNAPAFDVVGSTESVSIQSYYDSSKGGFSSTHRQQINKILQPKGPGQFKISDIRILANGKEIRAKDIWITVQNAYSGGGQSRPNRGVNRGPSPGISGRYGNVEPEGMEEDARTKGAKPVFLRVEVNKTSAYKGEQIIVSYYLYHRAKVLNVVPDKFPVLSGFLREDLDIPVAGQRLSGEMATVNGIPYEKTLLAKYAAFPLESRELDIDSMALKVSYYVNSSRNLFGDDDPFFGFFQQMAPRTLALQSDIVKVQVKDLPTAGKPKNFSGGVGQFDVTASVSKSEVRANEAITLTLKVNGKGNISGIQEPVLHWPESVEMYESKGKVSRGPNGASEKSFEYLLIPRTPGRLDLPAVEMGFFDSEKNEYYTRNSNPISINVLNPVPGSEIVQPKKSNPTVLATSVPAAKAKTQDVRNLKTDEGPSAGDFLPPIWRLLYWACSLAFLFFFALVGRDLFIRMNNRVPQSKEKKQRSGSKDWDRIRQLGGASASGAPWQEVLAAYDAISYRLLEALELKYGVTVRSVSLQQVHAQLAEREKFPQVIWERIVRVLEFSDQVRYARSSASNSEGPARSELGKWVQEAEAILQSLE
ncbi:MAG: protein BatD [Bdellovibrio sp.]|nr:protein BatD [Bdellovibrio sp.]